MLSVNYNIIFVLIILKYCDLIVLYCENYIILSLKEKHFSHSRMFNYKLLKY